MYSLVIYLYALCVNIAALFNRKARLLVRGHRKTYAILRRGIDPAEKYIWFHAASLGEFEQGRPLIELIHRNFPKYKILLTFFSPSGYEVRKDYKGADVCCYLPFDTMLNARKFIRIAHPVMAFFIKYEFWQNYLSRLHRENIPAYSVSSIFRPNQIFFRPYGRQYARVLHCFTHLFVQNEESLQLLRGRGIDNVTIVGDTRFDRVLAAKQDARPLPPVEAFCRGYELSTAHHILVGGSTWPDDEHFLLSYFNSHPAQKLILAPHVVSEAHLCAIERQLKRPSLRLSRATSDNIDKVDCLIVDCYGVLSSIYRYGHIAYIGGGFGSGIHNVPEAAVYGIPVVIGPNNRKFKEAQDLKRAGGIYEIHSPEEYASLMDVLTPNPQQMKQAGERALRYIEANSGAVGHIFDFVFRKKE